VRPIPEGNSARRTLILASLFVLCAGSLLTAQDPPTVPPRKFDTLQKADFTHAIGGDTINVKLAGREVAVRLTGVNAGADDAGTGDFLDRLLGGEEIYVEWAETVASAKDSKARSAFVFRSPDGLFVNLELVRLGYAKMQPGLEGDDGKAFHFYEHRARQAKKGVWSPGDSAKKPEPKAAPAEKPNQAGNGAKAGQASTGADNDTVYVTASGKKYHRSGCKFLTDTARAVTLSEARKSYEPCAHCKPPK